MPETIGIVGLGRVTSFHLPALESTAAVEVVGAVDPDPTRRLRFRGRTLPVWPSLEPLLDRSPSTVIVATPTPTHYPVCEELLRSGRPPRRVVVEKPLAATGPHAARLLSSAGGTEVICVYHAAHAPEVIWAVGHLADWSARFGPVSGFEMRFADPYANADGAADHRAAVYVDSWIDSGINALSVALRFASLTGITRLARTEEDGSYHAVVRFAAGAGSRTGTISTTWQGAEPEKRSVFTFSGGAQLTLDHQRISGRFEHQGKQIDTFAYRGNVPRLVSHYQDAFDKILVQRTGYCDAAASRLLHGLLYARPAEIRSGTGGAT